MSTLIHIPPANPIRFLINNVKGCYAQKYSPLDYTNVQVVTVGERTNIVLEIKDKYNRTIKSYSPRVDILANDYYFYTFSIDFFGLIGDYRIFITDGISEVYYWSGCINISTKNEKYPLLQYRNSENKDDVNYTPIEIFSLRVESGFMVDGYNPKSDDTTYQNQPVDFELLHSDTYYTWYFTAGGATGIPNDFHYIVHKALGNDAIYINGKGYTKYAGAEWESNRAAANYSKASWKIELVPNGETFTRTSESTSSEWQNYVCRTQNGAYTGYAAATVLGVYKYTASGQVIDGYPKLYSILSGFVYNEVIYPTLSESDYAALSYSDLNARALAFIQTVVSAEGEIPGITDRVAMPFNLISGEYNLISGEYNLITTLQTINGLIIDSPSCVFTGNLYAGGTISNTLITTEDEVKALLLEVGTNPLLQNVKRNNQVIYTIPAGIMKHYVIIPADLGEPTSVYDMDNSQEMKGSQQWRVDGQITVDGLVCNVCYLQYITHAVGTKQVRVTV